MTGKWWTDTVKVENLIRFYIRIPYSKNTTSITNYIVKETSPPFYFISYADEMEEIEAYGDYKAYLDEIYDRKRKNEQSMEEYQKAHDKWQIDYDVHLFGLPEHLVKREKAEFLEKHPEPQKPDLLNENIREKAKQKTARIFFMGIEHYASSEKEFKKVHEEIGKYILDLSMQVIEKGMIKEGLLSFTVCGKELSYEIKGGGSCVVVEQYKIESIERLKKANEDFKRNTDILEFKLKSEMEMSKHYKNEINSLEEKINKLEKEDMINFELRQNLSSFINLGMDDKDMNKAFSKYSECLELNCLSKEQIAQKVDEMKKILGKRAK